jgi:predicted N-formylglutamate amidohydrolase
VSRLLIDLNRSPHHKNLFSEFTRRMTEIDRHTINARYYQPYRTEIERCIAHLIGAGEKVIHVSVHSFTPRLHGHVRTADIGLLYDPGRAFESKVCDLWKAYFTNTEPTLRVKRNYPYRGTADGLTKYLRTRFAAGRYAGIELEINQRIPLGSAAAWRRLQRTITDTLVCLR